MRTWEEFKRTALIEHPIFALARVGDAAEIAKLKDLGEAIHLKNHKGYSALMLAAYNGSLETVSYLLQKGADANTTDDMGSTVLMGAAFKGDLPVVQTLIAAGANPAAQNIKGQTAIDFAQMFARSEVAIYLKRLQQQPATFSIADLLRSWVSLFFSKGAYEK